MGRLLARESEHTMREHQFASIRHGLRMVHARAYNNTFEILPLIRKSSDSTQHALHILGFLIKATHVQETELISLRRNGERSDRVVEKVIDYIVYALPMLVLNAACLHGILQHLAHGQDTSSTFGNMAHDPSMPSATKREIDRQIARPMFY